MRESKRSQKKQRKTKKQRGGVWPFTSSDGTGKSWFSWFGSTSEPAPVASSEKTASVQKPEPTPDAEKVVGTEASQNNNTGTGMENSQFRATGGRRKQKRTQKRKKQSNKNKRVSSPLDSYV